MSILRFKAWTDMEFDPRNYEHLAQQAVLEGRPLIELAREWEDENISCDFHENYSTEIIEPLRDKKVFANGYTLTKSVQGDKIFYAFIDPNGVYFSLGYNGDEEAIIKAIKSLNYLG